MLKVNNKNTLNDVIGVVLFSFNNFEHFTPFSSVSIVKFEQVHVSFSYKQSQAETGTKISKRQGTP